MSGEKGPRWVVGPEPRPLYAGYVEIDADGRVLVDGRPRPDIDPRDVVDGVRRAMAEEAAAWARDEAGEP